MRKRAEFPRLEVANVLQTSNESVSRIERGEQWPPFGLLSDLAELYNVERADLFVVPGRGRRARQRAALQEVADLLKPRKTEDVELARDLLQTLSERN